MTALQPFASLLALLLASPLPPQPLSTYHDDGLHFTFTYPADFKPEITEQETLAQARKDSPARLQAALGCATTPLIVTRQPLPRQFEMLMILRLDFGCMGRNIDKEVLTPMAVSSLREGLAKIGPPTLTRPVPYTLDGHDAVFVQGSAPDAKDGVPGHGAVACVLLVNTVACWSALTAYPTHLPLFFANSFHFDGRATQPLVPEGIVQIPEGNDPPSPTP